jgi:hypothetical protein
MACVEDRRQDVLRVLAEPGELFGVGARDAAGSVLDAFAFGILTDREQDLPYRPLDPLKID